MENKSFVLINISFTCLNYAKGEYSRCRIPRLVIDQEAWRMNKKKEKQELEVVEEEIIMHVNVDGEECIEVLEEERVFEMVEMRGQTNLLLRGRSWRTWLTGAMMWTWVRMNLNQMPAPG